jgi:hypothetical protein
VPARPRAAGHREQVGGNDADEEAVVTESAWDTCTEPQPMLAFLRGKASDRKLRLFAAACCRLVWDDLTTHRSRRAVEAAEEHADGLATEADLLWAHSQALSAANDFRARLVGRRLVNRGGPTVQEGRLFFAGQAAHAHRPFLLGRLGWLRHDAELGSRSPTLLRDIFGPLPFRPIAVADAWLTWNGGIVRHLVEAAYQERQLPVGTLDPARLGVLADALEEAGCADAELLGHLRGPGPHVRGCFAVDALLGRA